MSGAQRVTDARRTAIMVDLLHLWHQDRNGNAASHVVLEEVAPGTGWAARRWADVLVLSMWPSKGLTLDGFEVKASRADLKRELADLDKHQATARYCDTWNLLVWDEAVLKGFDIPEGWGLWITTGDDDNGRRLKCLRIAAKRRPEPWPRAFVCSMVRNAYEQSPGATWVAALLDNAAARSWERHRRDVAAARSTGLEPLCRALWGPNSFRWPKESRDPDAVLKLACERLASLTPTPREDEWPT